MNNIEPRKIKKIVRINPEGSRLTAKEVRGIVATDNPEDPRSPNERVSDASRAKTLQSAASLANAARDAANARREKQHLSYALSTPRTIEGFVALTQLASERGIQAQLARLWAIKAGLRKNGNRWAWKEDSRDLKRARKALGLDK